MRCIVSPGVMVQFFKNNQCILNLIDMQRVGGHRNNNADRLMQNNIFSINVT